MITYLCGTCGKELRNDIPVFVIDNQLFHNNANCVFGYTKKTDRKIKHRSPIKLIDAIDKLKF